jgi:EpsI family protein
MACTSILVLEMWVLAKIGPEKRPLREVFGLEFPEPLPEDADVRLRGIPRPFLVSGVVLFLALGLSYSLGERSEIVPERQEFSEFPVDFGEWHGSRGRLDQIYLDALKLDDHIVADFANGANKAVNFYAAYYASQSKGESAHSPRSCLPGGGWLIDDLSQITIDGVRVGGAPLTVNRVVIKKGDFTQLVYYWFQGRGRVITNEYMVKWFLFWDSLTRNRSDGALVRLTTFIMPGEDLTAGDRRLNSFAMQVSDTLGDYIPE